ncbi:MAG: hypothetical protein HKN82_05175 [Akkermansiaceae bacterium]|nr:hypothetical protein [Akkermansiaceae bacterium]
MKRNILTVAMTVHGVLVTSAMAHPGPPGHTHDDEWPFGPLALVALAILVAAAGAGVAWKRRHAAPAVRRP